MSKEQYQHLCTSILLPKMSQGRNLHWLDNCCNILHFACVLSESISILSCYKSEVLSDIYLDCNLITSTGVD